MAPMDMFAATAQVSSAISSFEDETVKRIILMALLARGLDDLLIDPTSILTTKVENAECPTVT